MEETTTSKKSSTSMTECRRGTSSPAAPFSRPVEAGFTGGSDFERWGAIVLPEVDRKMGSLQRLEASFQDRHDPNRVSRRFREMLAQRIVGIALGYQVRHDREALRSDPPVALITGKRIGKRSWRAKAPFNCLERLGRTQSDHKLDPLSRSD